MVSCIRLIGKKMKLIYIPKYRNEKRPFKITQIIQRVILNEDVDGLIFLPGYMSSSQGTIQNFISQMQNLRLAQLPAP